MLRCKEVVELLATEAWRDAPLARRLSLGVHLMMCRRCRAYRRALRRLGEAARTLYRNATPDAGQIERLLVAVRRAAEQPRP
ncbi:MAG: hypothetical protein Q8Q14_16035 [Gemmatimonadales bacterium]|nr:hypothetical protein [Gemmatimonadales bacterium]